MFDISDNEQRFWLLEEPLKPNPTTIQDYR